MKEPRLLTRRAELYTRLMRVFPRFLFETLDYFRFWVMIVTAWRRFSALYDANQIIWFFSTEERVCSEIFIALREIPLLHSRPPALSPSRLLLCTVTHYLHIYRTYLSITRISRLINLVDNICVWSEKYKQSSREGCVSSIFFI